MKGIDSTGAPLVHVLGWMDGWVDRSKSGFKDCLQQSKKLVGYFWTYCQVLYHFVIKMTNIFTLCGSF
jgi:hypothetical protein